ncbi:MAG: hypothetical protein R2731_10095 [Nocardioides sp.]
MDVALFHDEAGRRTLDVAGAGPDWAAHVERHLTEEAGEELRELYVSLTRAQSQVVAWWAPTANTPYGGLHRLLFGRQPGVPEVPDQVAVRDDEYTAGVLAALAELVASAAERSVLAAAAAPQPAAAPAPARGAPLPTAPSTPTGAARPTPG